MTRSLPSNSPDFPQYRTYELKGTLTDIEWENLLKRIGRVGLVNEHVLNDSLQIERTSDDSDLENDYSVITRSDMFDAADRLGKSRIVASKTWNASTYNYVAWTLGDDRYKRFNSLRKPVEFRMKDVSVNRETYLATSNGILQQEMWDLLQTSLDGIECESLVDVIARVHQHNRVRLPSDVLGQNAGSSSLELLTFLANEHYAAVGLEIPFTQS
jgi:hypothetical protein